MSRKNLLGKPCIDADIEGGELIVLHDWIRICNGVSSSPRRKHALGPTIMIRQTVLDRRGKVLYQKRIPIDYRLVGGTTSTNEEK
ncbi:predicted protein [Sclerotinia sclerotiorum 1980 UF-70]|uniref:Uncharacterized protein n=1 Tax=Sclerotinia sclerotiorum (strain ATCC 18683 / 1980 / Ss-1) TaxID=665079 RepID=A7EME6_SCLS1|nr:predicted protein [Sclerotinia sclerotiorum 1980 UF-70]EDO04012.1 predicted protein [Sclerotinia sclerotiorum 1980 UF-70]